MSIQQDILDTIGASGIGVKALRDRLGNVGAIELDIALRALQRARRVQVINDVYQVLPSTRPLGGMPHTGRPPSAEEEAAASLLPVTRVCVTCQGEPQALCEFRFIGPGDARSKECNTCHGKKTQAGQVKKRGQRSTGLVNGYTKRGEVMNPPESAAQGSEVGNLTTPHVNGTGAVPQGAEAQATQPSAAPIVFHSACREDTPSTPTQPTVSNDVFERVKAQRQAALNRIAILEVEVVNERAKLRECEEFLRLYERFAQGAK